MKELTRLGKLLEREPRYYQEKTYICSLKIEGLINWHVTTITAEVDVLALVIVDVICIVGTSLLSVSLLGYRLEPMYSLYFSVGFPNGQGKWVLTSFIF